LPEMSLTTAIERGLVATDRARAAVGKCCCVCECVCDLSGLNGIFKNSRPTVAFSRVS
jgi:hypothetical protein